jgi:membrane-bound lytic murein transglycosylase B
MGAKRVEPPSFAVRDIRASDNTLELIRNGRDPLSILSTRFDSLYGLVDLQNGAEPTEYWAASDNFFAITKYNRSYFYAMSVIDLGRAVRETRDNALL